MALKDTTHHMGKLLEELSEDLPKAVNGNRTAAQRVRTKTIQLAKVAKIFRKESILAEKGGLLKKKLKPTKGKPSLFRKKVLLKKGAKKR